MCSGQINLETSFLIPYYDALDRPLSNLMPHTGKISQQNADMSSTPGGLSQPLVQTQSGGQPTYLNTTNTGWSSDIQTQSGTRNGENMNMASSQSSHRMQVQANQMEKLGWSSNIGMESGGNTGMGTRNVDSNLRLCATTLANNNVFEQRLFSSTYTSQEKCKDITTPYFYTSKMVDAKHSDRSVVASS